VEWGVNSTSSPSAFLSLLAVLRAMRGSVGGWGGRGFLAPVLTLLLYRRLGQICWKMERLAARFEAGRLWRRVPRAVDAGRVPAAGDDGGRAREARVWPCRFGWLVRAAVHHAAVYGCQLRVILAEPEMVALLRESPQAVRLLRPVCRMLAIEASLLRPLAEGEIAPVAVAREVKVRVRRPRPTIDWGRIPLPRGVLAAARRQGFGKIR